MEKIFPHQNVDPKPHKIQQSYLRLELSEGLRLPMLGGRKDRVPQIVGDTASSACMPPQKITAVLPMKQAQEVLSLKRDRITVMPNMPNCVFGLINQRSRIFWVVDLCQLLELSPIDRSLQQYNIAIVRIQETALGLIVPAIRGVTRLALEDIQSPVGNVSPGLVPYLQGCFLQEKNILLVLDAEAIINSPVLQTG